MPALLEAVAGARSPATLVPWLSGSLCALDCTGPEGWGSPPGGAGPTRALLGLEPEVVFEGGLEALQSAREWLSPDPGRDPNERGLLGYLGYELGRELEPALLRPRDRGPFSEPNRQPGPNQEPDREPDRVGEPGRVAGTPPVWLAGFRALYHYRPDRRRGVVCGDDPRAVRRLSDRIREAQKNAHCGLPYFCPVELVDPPAAEYLSAVDTIKRYIGAGDVYQVNLSRTIRAGQPLSPHAARALWAALVSRFGAPFDAYLDAGRKQILSNSPERFLRILGNRVETCPIKGTRPRGGTQAQDRRLGSELLRSEKDRAEHTMIVDLERNDLGRICRTGSVRVERMIALRSFARVHHLISSVQGELVDPLDWRGLLRATFPGGSITGAPKLRAMQIIDSLEHAERGVYTGSIGHFDSAGGVDLSIAIRTAVVDRGRLTLRVGGGIVADSDPRQELLETLDKARAFLAACTADRS